MFLYVHFTIACRFAKGVPWPEANAVVKFGRPWHGKVWKPLVIVTVRGRKYINSSDRWWKKEKLEQT